MSILIVTKKMLTGGSIYEKNIAGVLGNNFQTNIFELDENKFQFLKFKRIKYFCQVRFGNLPKTDTVIISTAALKSGIPLKKYSKKILVVHHYDPDENRRSLLHRTSHKYVLSRLEEFDSVVVVCKYWGKYLENYISPNKIKVIYNSFDTDSIKTIISNFDTEAFKDKYDIPKNKKIIYAGNSIPNKGITNVVEQLKDADYHIITSGRKEIDCGNQHLLLSYIDYLRLLNISDVSVLLSTLLEGWNRCAHESLICGTPVIGTDSAGLGELLKLSGQLIYKDNDDLKELILKSNNNTEFADKGRKFAERYNYEYFRNEWENVLDR